VDGVLVVLSTGDQPLDEVEKAGIPYLAINGHAGPHGTTLLLDEDDAVRQVMAYLVGLGHRRIAYRNTPLSPSHYSVTARHRAYLAACTAHGLTPAPGHDRLPAADADFLRQARADGATAVLAYSHVEAMALLFAAAKAGLRIPTDMSLAAFNDVYPVAEIVPSLTVMAQPLDEMGDTAGRLLVDMMKHDRRDPRCIEFKQSLIVRQSTAAPAPRRPHDDA
jgi:DNA-binding LacI/PurR family transcriptional regulator